MHAPIAAMPLPPVNEKIGLLSNDAALGHLAGRNASFFLLTMAYEMIGLLSNDAALGRDALL